VKMGYAFFVIVVYMRELGNFRIDFVRNVSLGVASMACQSLFILADTFFIANGVGAAGIASLNIVLPVISIINGIGWMMGVGGGTLFSTSLGREQTDLANEYFSFTTMLALIVGLLFVLFSWLLSHQILTFLGASDKIYVLAKEYYDVVTGFSFLFIINNMFITFLRNDHNPKLAMVAFSVGGILNILLDYIFIFPLDMGMKGAAWATVISPLASMAIMSLHIKNNSRELRFRRWSIGLRSAKRVVMLGFSSFLNEFSSALIMFLFNIVLLNLVGDIAVSAYAIIANMNIIAISIFTGIGQGIQPLASINFGAKNYELVKKTLKYGLCIALAMGVLFFVLGLSFSREIVSIFNGDNNEMLSSIAEPGLSMYFLSFLFAGVNFVAVFFTAAIGKSRMSMTISLLRGLVLIVPVLFVMKHAMGIDGVWLTMPVVELLTFVFVVGGLVSKKITTNNII
jgi:putative MATE family efflux protein